LFLFLTIILLLSFLIINDFLLNKNLLFFILIKNHVWKYFRFYICCLRIINFKFFYFIFAVLILILRVNLFFHLLIYFIILK